MCFFLSLPPFPTPSLSLSLSFFSLSPTLHPFAFISCSHKCTHLHRVWLMNWKKESTTTTKPHAYPSHKQSKLSSTWTEQTQALILDRNKAKMKLFLSFLMTKNHKISHIQHINTMENMVRICCCVLLLLFLFSVDLIELQSGRAFERSYFTFYRWDIHFLIPTQKSPNQLKHTIFLLHTWTHRDKCLRSWFLIKDTIF